MRSLFLPAISLTNRLSYTRKLVLLGLLSLVATSVVTYQLFINVNPLIISSRLELEGVALIKPFARAVQLTQLHRGLSTGVLNGIDSMQDQRTAVSAEIIATLASLEVMLPAKLASSDEWRNIKENWRLLNQAGTSSKAADNFSAHTRLIRQLHSLELSVADECGLTLDSEIASYYLINTLTNKLPDAVEHLAQIRAYGMTTLLAGGQASERQLIKLHELVAQLEDVLPDLKANIQKVALHRPELQEALLLASHEMVDSTKQIIDLLNADIFTRRFTTNPQSFFLSSTASIDKSYSLLYDSLLPETEKVIQARISRAETGLHISLMVTILLLLVVIYFAIGIYYATMDSIQSLVHSAHAFATGDIDKRVSLDTRDELKFLGDSFNEMADGFKNQLAARKTAEELIWKQANYDPLTELPNRTMFQYRIAQEVKKAHRDDFQLALLFIDLDEFKEINDTLGHHIGDLLLVQAAQRLTSCVRETDTVVRLGGDEFAVILSELEDANSILRIVRDILRNLAEAYRLNSDTVYVSASIGITMFPDDATTTDELLKNADQAMYVAKNAGRNRFEFFTSSMQKAAQSRLRLVNDLRCALSANQFEVYFQPIVTLSTGLIHKAEALIRWKHPELGMISPAKFIPLAEESGLIIDIGDWVFKETARQLKQWRVTHNIELQISVNMSPKQFYNADNRCEKIWAAYLQELGLPKQSIVIEITEGLLLGAETKIVDKLLAFHEAGIQISIDDFGTGYSSLSYLKKFDIDYLKIDQSFVRDLATDPSDMALTEAIIVMAHKLGLKVIAEGVETEIQRGLLAVACCDYVQGYLYSKPVPAAEFESLLKNNLSNLLSITTE